MAHPARPPPQWVPPPPPAQNEMARPARQPPNEKASPARRLPQWVPPPSRELNEMARPSRPPPPPAPNEMARPARPTPPQPSLALSSETRHVHRHIQRASDSERESAFQRLHMSINCNKPWITFSILKLYPEFISTSELTSGETPLMMAIKRGGSSSSSEYIAKFIEMTPDEGLLKQDNDENTLLASYGGNEQGHCDMKDYLLKMSKQQGYDDPFVRVNSEDLLQSAITAGMNDVIIALSYNNPNLVSKYSGGAIRIHDSLDSDLACSLCKNSEYLEQQDSSILEALAEDPSAFLEEATTWSRWKEILRSVCKRVYAQNNWSKFGAPFFLAAQNGIEDIVDMILDYHPDAINFVDGDDHSVLHLAVMYRRENIFKLVYQFNVQVSRRLLSMPDKKGNNILHLAGYPARQSRLDQSTRVILQMQRELKWFKELENLLSPWDMKLQNKLGKTPLTVFNEEHKDMVTTEIQWITGMASACSVAAPLIATVAFAAAITVPGGNNSNVLPMFSNHKSFMVFAASDAIALFAYIACVLSFLSIFTSRYGVDDFLRALPDRLIIGLDSLFIAAISLMVAFGTTLFLIFGQKNSLFLIPIIAFSCAPVIIYAILQLRSLLNLIKSTYGRRLLV